MARGRVRVSSAGLSRCTMTVPPRLPAVYTCPVACLAPLSGLRTQVAQYRQHATVVVGCGGQLELADNIVHVRFDGLIVERQPIANGFERPSAISAGTSRSRSVSA